LLKPFLAATALALTVALTYSGVASAALSANISPANQNHAHGVSSHWALTWGGAQPFDVYFAYDVINAPAWTWFINGTTTTSKNLSMAYWPCTTTNFKQQLAVYDHNGGLGLFRTSHAYESGGSPCT
jgi:hypothetical protein